MAAPRLSQRVFALLVMLGISILLARTILMLTRGALGILVTWVGLLLIAEFLLDAGSFLSSVPWLISNDSRKSRWPLRLAVAAIILHVARALVFVMGRVGPWIDFDVRPEQRALHGSRWNWSEVYFVTVMSVLGVLGVLVAWRLVRRAQSKADSRCLDQQ